MNIYGYVLHKNLCKKQNDTQKYPRIVILLTVFV